MDSICFEIFWKKHSLALHFVEMDTGPDQHYSDQDPPKLCSSDQIRIHNTAKEEIHHAKGHHFKAAILKGQFLCAG
jgi:hypothetical protein